MFITNNTRTLFSIPLQRYILISDKISANLKGNGQVLKREIKELPACCEKHLYRRISRLIHQTRALRQHDQKQLIWCNILIQFLWYDQNHSSITEIVELKLVQQLLIIVTAYFYETV